MDIEPVCWPDDYFAAALEGQLMEVLRTLPRTRWTERGPLGATLLHYASIGPNTTAARALLVHGLDPNARHNTGCNCVHDAALNAQPHVLEVLCAAGADLRATVSGSSALDLTFPRSAQCARVLVANGVRLSTVREEFRVYITPELEAFERGVLRCRAAVVALLALKRRQCVDTMRQLDRWVVREVGYAVWATRSDRVWQ